MVAFSVRYLSFSSFVASTVPQHNFNIYLVCSPWAGPWAVATFYAAVILHAPLPHSNFFLSCYVLSCVLQSYILKCNCQYPIVVFLNWNFPLLSYHRFLLLTFLSSLNRVRALISLIKSQDHNFLPSAPSSHPLSLTHMSPCVVPSSPAAFRTSSVSLSPKLVMKRSKDPSIRSQWHQ